MNKIKISYSQYDALIDKIEEMDNVEYFPTIEEVNYMMSDVKKHWKFLCYLDEKAVATNSKEEYSKKIIREVIRDNIEFIEKGV